jgi:L-alanine-DL-glutamate epimerase-like enolase superfamily enzyme
MFRYPSEIAFGWLSLRISDVRVTRVAVPFDKFGEWAPVKMWYGTRHASLHSVISVDTDDRITGLGCARDTSEDLILNVFRPKLIRLDPFDVEKIGNLTMRLSAGRRPDASAGIDNALWDIIGKACERPVYKLLGGKVHDKVRCSFWECMELPDKQAADCKKAVELGWKSFKVKIGVGPKVDVESVRKIREAVGDDVELSFDVNAGYRVSTAIATIRKMERYDPACIEQPVAEWDLKGLARVRHHVDVPIKCHSFFVNDLSSVLRLVDLEAADMLNLNPDFIGSLLLCKRSSLAD